MSMSPKELKERIKGVLHLVMTPFDADEELDEKALRESLRYVVNKLKGEDAVFIPTGSTGEFYAMTDKECRKVAKITVEEVNGEFPVMVGTARAGTKPAIEMSRYVQDVGADGVMIVLPYYHLVTKEGIYRHYKKIADDLDIGIMIYNNPVASKLWIPPDLMARLSKIENIVANKENTSNAVAYYWMQKAVDPEDMVIVCGLGQLMYPFEALFGCPGYVTELANFVPEIATGIYKAAMQKDFNRLTELIDKITPYHQFISKIAQRRGALPTVLSPHIAIAELPFYQSVCKEAMNLIGLPASRTRDPMENITSEEKDELRGILKDLGAL
jgi:4-hydroxy-tetrahydrodipicolinate synthase